MTLYLRSYTELIKAPADSPERSKRKRERRGALHNNSIAVEITLRHCTRKDSQFIPKAALLKFQQVNMNLFGSQQTHLSAGMQIAILLIIMALGRLRILSHYAFCHLQGCRDYTGAHPPALNFTCAPLCCAIIIIYTMRHREQWARTERKLMLMHVRANTHTYAPFRWI